MAAVAEELTSLFSAPESLDPTDADALGDDTVAGSRRTARRRSPGVSELAGGELVAPEPGRLRLRPKVPVLPKYHGQKVSRSEVFGDDAEVGDGVVEEEEEDAEDDEDQAHRADASAFMDGGVAGGLGIPAGVEQEYEQMMQQNRQGLEVLRAPSLQETQRREVDAQQLRRQLDTWGAFLELRIHLEGALAFGHRLPVGSAGAALRAADDAVAAEAQAAAASARGLLASLLELQQRLAARRGVPVDPSGATSGGGGGRQGGEPAAWASVDARVQQVLDWELGVADEWKERTRLDVRRSFKVLDQSLATQMQALAETEPAKLRKRCTPPPGRHAVFGASLCSAPVGGAKAGTEGEATHGGSEGREDGEGEGAEQDIFDDREFYVQLLREVLASGGKPGSSLGTGGDRELQAELQGRRAAKRRAKAEVERRASKGRKIRYVPIEKLQNFMAPRPRTHADGLDSLDRTLAGGQGAADAMLRALFKVPGGA